ncbi:MAG: rhomboid family intramembrane serine protease [Sneathiellaceae bacterium]
MSPPRRSPFQRPRLQGTGGGQPLLNLPPMVTALLVITVGIYIVQMLLPHGMEQELIFRFGFIPLRFGTALEDPLTLVTPVSYMFLHGGFFHLVINMVFLASFGSGVERLMGGGNLVLFYIVSGVAGAFAQYVLDPTSFVPMVGASGAISGLFGAVILMMNRVGGGNRQQVLILVVVWIGISVVFGMTGVPGVAEQIAWAAHVGGFLAGLALFAILFRRRRS